MTVIASQRLGLAVKRRNDTIYQYIVNTRAAILAGCEIPWFHVYEPLCVKIHQWVWPVYTGVSEIEARDLQYSWWRHGILCNLAVEIIQFGAVWTQLRAISINRSIMQRSQFFLTPPSNFRICTRDMKALRWRSVHHHTHIGDHKWLK